MDTTETIAQLVDHPDKVDDYILNLEDRELLEFTAVNIIGVTRLLKGIHDGIAPTIEKLAPMLSGMGL
jgi:hypothetical protein